MPTPLANVSDNKARTFVFYAAAVLAHVAPGLAGRLALRMFSTPKRTTPREVEGIDGAESWSIGYAGRRLTAWRWRPSTPNGRKVLLVHGWSGHAFQFARWVPALLARGYEVIGFDAPAHGKSTGERTNLLDFAGAVRQVAAVVGGVDAVVAHSMGGAATIVAASEGLGAARIVLLATPDNVEARLDRFADWLKLPASVRAAMERHLARRVGRPLRSLQLTRLAPRIKVPVLVVHDEGDREIPWLEGARTAAALPEGELLTVRGLGHMRVLRDAGVIEAAVGFVSADDAARHELRDVNLEEFVNRFEAA